MTETNTGIDFNFSFAPSITDPQILGFEIAGEIWSQHLADTYQGDYLEINIHIDATDELLPDNVVGGAFPAIETGIQYGDIYDALQDDAITEIDNVVKDSLLDRRKIDILVGGDVIDKNFKTHVTRANLKALGMVEGDSTQLDGYIFVNDLYDTLWSYDYLGKPEEGTLDFLSMAQHEIGHVLGFISGAKHTEESVGNRITDMSTMDLFRYSAESAELGINDMTYGQLAFFSIDGEETNLQLATGSDHQIGHFAQPTENNNQDQALMSPTISLGKRWSITGSDLLVLDSIGWDVVNPGVIDMAAIYSKAQAEAESSSIEDRRSDVENYVLNGDAYHWGSSHSSGSGWWQEAYFMEVEATIDETTGETHYHFYKSGSENFWDTVETIVYLLKDWWENYQDNGGSWGDGWWSDGWWGDGSSGDGSSSNNDDDD